MKKRIGIDFDDVLMDFNTALAVFHNTYYGTNYAREDIRSFDLGMTWNVPLDEARRRVEEFFHSDAHVHALPVRGSKEAVQQLGETYELHIVTARSEYMQVKTEYWLNSHFAGRFAGVHFTNQFLASGAKRTKSDVSKELGLVHFIDDHIENLREMENVGTTALLFDTPWNRHEILPVNVTRVLSWEDIAQKLL